MPKEYFNPDSLFMSSQYGFSQIVTSTPGRLVYISGQTAWDRNQEIVGKNDLAVQTKKSINNIKSAIESIGGSLADITMLRLYIVDESPDDNMIIGEVLREFFGKSIPPASTWIGVMALANPEFLIEIEAQAVIDI